MLITNQRLDKLAAARVEFAAHRMLHGPLLPSIPEHHIWDGLDLEDYDAEDLDDVAERHAALEDDEDGGPVDDTDVLGRVTLAKRKGAPLASVRADYGY